MKDKRVSVRLTTEEHTRFKRKTERLGTTMSIWLRREIEKFLKKEYRE